MFGISTTKRRIKCLVFSDKKARLFLKQENVLRLLVPGLIGDRWMAWSMGSPQHTVQCSAQQIAVQHSSAVLRASAPPPRCPGSDCIISPPPPLY
mmetsp:Transcript_16675/g.27084  ORF Transcript_16675/g.27084 Transcript_16675/m.27084 type:complete len:95 (+) Transcript_16675:125-409(+)